MLFVITLLKKVDARPNVDKAEPDMQIYTFLTKDTAIHLSGYLWIPYLNVAIVN